MCATNALTGAGIQGGLDWIVDQLEKKHWTCRFYSFFLSRFF
jgi:hypothetical protein